MKIGQYVKAAGAYGTVVATPTVEGVGGIADVLLNGDAEPTEFWIHELVPARRPRSSRIRNDIHGMAARTSAGAANDVPPGFIPVPEAGIFTAQCLAELDERYEKSRALFNKGGVERVGRQTERVTLSSMNFGKRGRS